MRMPEQFRNNDCGLQREKKSESSVMSRHLKPLTMKPRPALLLCERGVVVRDDETEAGQQVRVTLDVNGQAHEAGDHFAQLNLVFEIVR